MKSAVRAPIRRKILISLMLAITLVVSLITFTMARFFHQDKQAYVNDWASIAAVSTADECRSLIVNYRQRLELYAAVMLSDSIGHDERVGLLQRLFDELPELVEVAMYHGDEELEIADEMGALEELQLTEEQMRAFRATHPLPLDRILAGQLHVSVATFSPVMPGIELAFASSMEGYAEPVVLAAVLRADRLMRLGSKFEVFEVLIEAQDGSFLAHPDPQRVIRGDKAEHRPEFRALRESNQAGFTVEYDDDGTEMLAGFAPAEVGNITVMVRIPKSAAYLASRNLLGRLLLVALALLLTVSAAGLVWAHRITRPMERLSQATRKIARGEFDVQVEVDSHDEIGALASSFNQMASELDSRERALKEAHGQLIQSEKMAAFGQLGAGIAHEVKNPLTGILGCTQLSLMDVEEGSDTHHNLLLIEKETQRCKTIIENLLKFARQEQALLEPIDPNTVVQDAVMIVNHQLEMQQVKLHCELNPELPLVRGNANQLQQVLMNLMINAQQAMQGAAGHVIVSTRLDGKQVEIIVRDDGPGIPAQIQGKLFEPFFTTKPTGEGTGLGLSVSYGIIKAHGGEIVVDSSPPDGAAFIIRIPAMGDRSQDASPVGATDSVLAEVGS